MDNELSMKYDEAIAKLNKMIRSESFKTGFWAALSVVSIGKALKHNGRVGYICGLKTTTKILKENF